MSRRLNTMGHQWSQRRLGSWPAACRLLPEAQGAWTEMVDARRPKSWCSKVTSNIWRRQDPDSEVLAMTASGTFGSTCLDALRAYGRLKIGKTHRPFPGPESLASRIL